MRRLIRYYVAPCGWVWLGDCDRLAASQASNWATKSHSNPPGCSRPAGPQDDRSRYKRPGRGRVAEQPEGTHHGGADRFTEPRKVPRRTPLPIRITIRS
jgi:hypothetical protein